MKKYFITGLVFLLPFVITLYILIWLIDFFTEPFMGIVKSLLLMYEQQGNMILQRHEKFFIFIDDTFAICRNNIGAKIKIDDL